LQPSVDEIKIESDGQGLHDDDPIGKAEYAYVLAGQFVQEVAPEDAV
jgi:hypothetical protein